MVDGPGGALKLVIGFVMSYVAGEHPGFHRLVLLVSVCESVWLRSPGATGQLGRCDSLFASLSCISSGREGRMGYARSPFRSRTARLTRPPFGSGPVATLVPHGVRNRQS